MTIDPEELRPWITEEFSRSAGPGGQNVNKVSTRVTLLFDVAACPLLSDEWKHRVERMYAGRLSRDGSLRVVSSKERTQLGNRRAALERLMELLAEAAREPRKRRPTRPTRGSVQRRLSEKRRRSTLRQSRAHRADSE